MTQRFIWTLQSIMRLNWRDTWGALLKNQRPLHGDPKGEVLHRAMSGQKVWKLPPGDYLEFGVYRGRSFIHAWRAARRLKLDEMQFYAFDSFEGLPEVGGVDRAYQHFVTGQYACTQAEFRQILQRAGVDLSRVTMVPGFYDQSLTDELKAKLPIERAAVVWVDCDLYESTVPVLEFVTDYLTSGTVLVFDDWFSFGGDPQAGELRATNEWLERHPDITLEDYHLFGVSGKSFLVQRHGG